MPLVSDTEREHGQSFVTSVLLRSPDSLMLFPIFPAVISFQPLSVYDLDKLLHLQLLTKAPVLVKPHSSTRLYILVIPAW